MTSQQACGAVTQAGIAVLSLSPQSSLSGPHERDEWETFLSPCHGQFSSYLRMWEDTERYERVGWFHSFLFTCMHSRIYLSSIPLALTITSIWLHVVYSATHLHI